MSGSYDEACLELATEFLSDEPLALDKHRQELAVVIQEAIEDYLERTFDVATERPGAGAEKP